MIVFSRQQFGTFLVDVPAGSTIKQVEEVWQAHVKAYFIKEELATVDDVHKIFEADECSLVAIVDAAAEMTIHF